MIALDSGVKLAGRLIHPLNSKFRQTIVLAAYLDDSGTDGQQPIVVVAGFVATIQVWATFESVWLPFLKEHGLARFHAAEYWAKKSRPYNSWDDIKHLTAREDIGKIFKRINPLGFGTAIRVREFEAWRKSIDYFVPPDPYHFCLDRVLKKLIRGVSQVPQDEGIAVYIDQDKGRQALGMQLAEWHEERLRQSDDERMNKERIVSVTYGSSVNFCPLQASDIFAHATYQWLREHLRTDELEPEPFFIKAFKDGRVPFSVEFLEDRDLIDVTARLSRDGKHGAMA